MTIPLLDYQHTGAEFLAARERAGLFDEPGVGKTAQAIAACDRIAAQRILVVCPAAVKQVWVGEFKKFSPVQRKVLKANGIHELNSWLRGKADVLIASYEMASKWVKHVNDLYDVLILDEAHYVKTHNTQRTRAMLGTQCDGAKGLGLYASHVWFLTGTPAANDPTDVWPFLRFVGGTNLTLPTFTTRYFKSWNGTFSARQEPRKEMVGELRALIERHSLRRTKDQAGLNLPPIWLTTQTVDGDTEEILSLLREHPGLEQAIVAAIEQGGLSFLDAQHISTLRRLVGEAKAPAYLALLLEELRGGLEKVVVMGVHTRALMSLAEGLERAGVRSVSITGATSEPQRVAAVSEFQNDPACKVFIGNVRAAGTGLTLTAAAEIVMFESSWTPAENAQALMRVHRIGQTRTVRGRFISLANSIDEVVVETVARKTSSISQIGVDYNAVPE